MCGLTDTWKSLFNRAITPFHFSIRIPHTVHRIIGVDQLRKRPLQWRRAAYPVNSSVQNLNSDELVGGL
jgi:hypothetical protein